MTISTKDCKDFLSNNSHLVNSSPNDSWTRIKKYKDGELVLRDFRSDKGIQVTLSEKNNKLSIHNLHSNRVCELKLSTYPTLHQLQTFMANCVKTFPNILHEISPKEDEPFPSEESKLKIEEYYGIPYNEYIKQALVAKNWEFEAVFSKRNAPFSDLDTSYFDIEDNLTDFDDSWHQFNKCIADSDGSTHTLDKNDILEYYWLFNLEYDTNFRFFIYLTKDFLLVLGENESD